MGRVSDSAPADGAQINLKNSEIRFPFDLVIVIVIEPPHDDDPEADQGFKPIHIGPKADTLTATEAILRLVLLRWHRNNDVSVRLHIRR